MISGDERGPQLQTRLPIMTPSRKLNWISATDQRNAKLLADLQQRMVNFYASSEKYYEDIDFTAKAWLEDECYRDIVRRLHSCGSIAEVGCGSANILLHHDQFISRYIGCDFSSGLLARNRDRYHGAQFRQIQQANTLPFETASVDAVFSVFVIEHVVYPHLFLDECHRVLKPGGLFILRCPNFLGAGCMASQRAGFSRFNGREKLAKGRVLDAMVTFWDRKIAIPRHCAKLRKNMKGGGAFWLNAAPTCVVDPFIPDVDAVYLTYDKEMISYLHGRIDFDSPSSGLSEKFPIYITGRKREAQQ